MVTLFFTFWPVSGTHKFSFVYLVIVNSRTPYELWFGLVMLVFRIWPNKLLCDSFIIHWLIHLPSVFPTPNLSKKMTRGIKHRQKAKSKKKVQPRTLFNVFYYNNLTSLWFFVGTSLFFFYKILFKFMGQKKFRSRRKRVGLLHLWRQKFPRRCGNRVWISWRKVKSFSVILLLTILFMPFTLDGHVWGICIHASFFLFDICFLLFYLAPQEENKTLSFLINKPDCFCWFC